MRILIWRSFSLPRSRAQKNSAGSFMLGPLRSVHSPVRRTKNCCSNRTSNVELADLLRVISLQHSSMRFLRAFFIAIFTAFGGCLPAVFVGDYLTRVAHVP